MSAGENTSYLSPSVFWAQTAEAITLKIDLLGVEKPNIDMEENHLGFSACCYATALGGKKKTYRFSLQFFSQIDTKNSDCKISETRVNFHLKKKEKLWWPRLTAQPQKPHWLKIDFDRWQTPDDFNDEDDAPSTCRNIEQDYPGMYERLEKEEYGYIREQTKQVYLTVYNLAQFCGYLYVFSVTLILYYRDGPAAIPETYRNVGNALKFCQLLQYLEVLHPMFGYTSGSVFVPFLQVSGRNFILFIMLDQEERIQNIPAVFYLFLIWTCIEVVRYPYYVMRLLKLKCLPLTWLRYTIWIPLYPAGIVCEGIVVLRNLPYFEETKRFSVQLPNSWNWTFCMPTFMALYLLVLIGPVTYLMMEHMSRARSKQLSGKTTTMSKKSKRI